MLRLTMIVFESHKFCGSGFAFNWHYYLDPGKGVRFYM